MSQNPNPAPAETFLDLLAREPWALARHATLTLAVTNWGKIILDTSRFGRPFHPWHVTLRIARVNKGLSESDLARAIDRDRSIICRMEAPGGDKLHASSDLVQQLAIGLGLEPLESYLAYVSDVRPFHRLFAYPDDPGTLGAQFGLPLPGATERLKTRPPK